MVDDLNKSLYVSEKFEREQIYVRAYVHTVYKKIN